VADEEKESTDGLEALRTELESLKREKEALDGRLEAREATIVELQAVLATRETEVADLKQGLAESGQKLAEINGLLAQAVASYRELMVVEHPEIPPEFITGDSVESVDESLQSAQTLVDKVKKGIEAENSRTRVPVGAPPRAPLDLSGLSPREKIQYAIGGKR